MTDYIDPLWDDQVDATRLAPWGTSRRVAVARPPVPPPVRALDLRTDDPVFPKGIVRRLGHRHEGEL